MAEPIEYRRIFQKVDTLAGWNANPLILGDGEWATVRDNGVVTNYRIGDGTKRFSELPNVIQYDQAAYVASVGNTLPVPASGVGYSLLFPGTYNGNLVVPAGNLGKAEYGGGSWSVTSIPMPTTPTVDNLLSQSSTTALSANQGNVLAKEIGIPIFEKNIQNCTSPIANAVPGVTIIFNQPIIMTSIPVLSLFAVENGNISLGTYRITGSNVVRITQTTLALVKGLNTFKNIPITSGDYVGIFTRSDLGGNIGMVTESAPYSHYRINNVVGTTATALPSANSNTRFGFQILLSEDGLSTDLNSVKNATTYFKIKDNAVNLFSNGSIIDNSYVDLLGNIVTGQSGWKILRLPIDSTRKVLGYKNFFARLNQISQKNTGMYYRFTSATNSLIANGGIDAYSEGGVSIPTLATTFDINIKAPIDGSDFVYSQAILSYDVELAIKQPVNVESKIKLGAQYEFSTVRKPVISFVFDDMTATDLPVFNILREYGFFASYALIANSNLNTTLSAMYRKMYDLGAGIVSHSTDDAPMRLAGISDVEAKMKNSKETISSRLGINVDGWQTPSSQLNSEYFPILDKYYGYGFVKYEDTDGSNGGAIINDYANYAPNRLGRFSIESNTIEAIKSAVDYAISNNSLLVFYGHNLNGTGSASFPESKLREILAYVKAKKDNYECEVFSVTEAVKYYYRTRYND